MLKLILSHRKIISTVLLLTLLNFTLTICCSKEQTTEPSNNTVLVSQDGTASGKTDNSGRVNTC